MGTCSFVFVAAAGGSDAAGEGDDWEWVQPRGSCAALALAAYFTAAFANLAEFLWDCETGAATLKGPDGRSRTGQASKA